MTFGEKLYRLRKERGWSQEALAQEMDVSRQAVSRWELGEVVPDTANILAVSRIFGVSTDYLLRDDCDSENETPVVQSAERSLKRRQIMAGGGFFARCFALGIPAIVHSNLRQGIETDWPILGGMALVICGILFRLNWDYYTTTTKPARILMVPDLACLAIICILPRFLRWVPGGYGLLLSQLAMIPFLLQSCKVLWLHYGLGWKKHGKG